MKEEERKGTKEGGSAERRREVKGTIQGCGKAVRLMMRYIVRLRG